MSLSMMQQRRSSVMTGSSAARKSYLRPPASFRSGSTRQRPLQRIQSSGSNENNSSQPQEGGNNLEEAASKILRDSPQTKAALDRIDAAQRRVLDLQAAQAQLREQIAATGQVAHDSPEDDGEAAAAAGALNSAARDYELAQAEVMEAERERSRLRRQARKEEDRVQSAVAGLIGAFGGMFAHLPLLFALQQPFTAKLLSLGSVAASSALFAIVYRYAVRTEADAADKQLKGGVIGAFGLTAGLASSSLLMGTALHQGDAISLNLVAEAALLNGASMLQFAITAAAVEVAISRNVLSRSSRV